MKLLGKLNAREVLEIAVDKKGFWVLKNTEGHFLVITEAVANGSCLTYAALTFYTEKEALEFVKDHPAVTSENLTPFYVEKPKQQTSFGIGPLPQLDTLSETGP